MTIESYIKVYDNFLSDQECDQICQQDGWKSHEWTDSTGKVIRRDEDLYITYLDEKFKYVVERFEHPTTRYSIETNACAGNTKANIIRRGSTPRLNKYYKGQHMDPHSDLIRDIFDGVEKGVPVLSTIVTLNDNFKGGELLFNLKSENKKIAYKLNKGSVIIWPSTFLYEHEVTPVIEGERISMVTWFW